MMENKKDAKEIIKEQLGISYELIQKRAFQQARALLKRIIKSEPHHNSLYMLLGYFALVEEKWEEAKKWYLKGLELESDSPTLLVLLAEALLMCKIFNEARKKSSESAGNRCRWAAW